MQENFEPKFFNPESGERKPILPEELAEMKREEKRLERKELSRTIRLRRDATFVDLARAEDIIAAKVRESEDDDEDADDPTNLIAEMWDNFDDAIASEALDLRNQALGMLLKRPEEYTEEEKKLANLKILEYFQSKGYSLEDIEAYLTIKFRKRSVKNKRR